MFLLDKFRRESAIWGTAARMSDISWLLPLAKANVTATVAALTVTDILDVNVSFVIVFFLSLFVCFPLT